MLAEITISSLFAFTICIGLKGTSYESFLGKTDFDRQKFAQAMEGWHKSYDPVEKMIGNPYSSEGYHYHTDYKGNVIHPTRESLGYAVACLDSGIPELIQRAFEVLDKVISFKHVSLQRIA